MLMEMERLSKNTGGKMKLYEGKGKTQKCASRWQASGDHTAVRSRDRAIAMGFVER